MLKIFEKFISDRTPCHLVYSDSTLGWTGFAHGEHSPLPPTASHPSPLSITNYKPTAHQLMKFIQYSVKSCHGSCNPNTRA